MMVSSSTGMDQLERPCYQDLLDTQLVRCSKMPSGSESIHNICACVFDSEAFCEKFTKCHLKICLIAKLSIFKCQ